LITFEANVHFFMNIPRLYDRLVASNQLRYESGQVIYWMSRDQRVNDNWAFLYAYFHSLQHKVPLRVCFCVVKNYPGAIESHLSYMMQGLRRVANDLTNLRIPFDLLEGDPVALIPDYIIRYKVGFLVGDFDPLRIKQQWLNTLIDVLKIPYHVVDAHNIVPFTIASGKAEYGAYTLRPKINKVLNDFFIPFPEVDVMKNQEDANGIPDLLKDVVVIDNPIDSIDNFINNNLKLYNEYANNPVMDITSRISALLHFGQVSSQRVALEVLEHYPDDENRKSYLEQIIIRKELSDNFCYYNKNYDSPDGFPSWAKKTLMDHMNDKRDYLYSLCEFEESRTHDSLWNAAQNQMRKTGFMHNYMRMYWAKKILEWTKSPQEAMEIAIYLNDKYELDGRDPNGYAGIAWSIGGVHDRAWGERPVFGKIRFMNERGCRNKFDVNEYVKINLIEK